MRNLSLLILAFPVLLISRVNQSPHGSDFKISCNTCHSAKSWELDRSVYSFDHNKTKMPLAGQHLTLNCRECHKTLVFKEAKVNCTDCHKDVHQNTTGNDCSQCHNQTSWLVTNIFRIHQTTRFPLMGPHRNAECFSCHKSESLLRYDVQGTNCIDCHRTEYQATTNPNHIKSGMSTDCIGCHSPTAYQWKGAGFNHNTFPLLQGHSGVKCTDCHTSGAFNAIPTACYTCHQGNYQAAKSPDHAASGFSTNCQDCHTLAAGWKPASFDHSKFPLTQGHSLATCTDCHKSGVFSALPTDCYTCHQQNYTATTNPNHVAAGFSTACQTCHTTVPGWKPATFNHTVFPLTLGHSTPACADCHKSGNYSSTPTDCYSCHKQDFTATSNPNHVTAGFPTTCTTCHTTNPGWKPASYNHSAFPLTQGHSGVSCTDCHKNGNYTALSTDCNTCHATDYNNTTNPNHKTLGFSTTCTQCHTTNPGWKPASYTAHDSQFPIYSGRHKGVWTNCSECHTNTANYALFDCKRCHTDVHKSNNYSNAQCYSCHPRGTTN